MDDYISKPIMIDELIGVLKFCHQSISEMFAEKCKNEPSLDWDRVGALREMQCDDEPDLFEELAEMFLTDVPLQAEQMAMAFQSGDREKISSVAHSIKGICWNIGAQRLATICLTIELNCKETSWQSMESLILESAKEIESISEILNTNFNTKTSIKIEQVALLASKKPYLVRLGGNS